MSPQHQWRYTNSSFIVWGTWTGCSCRTHVAKEVQSCNWWPLTLTLFPSRLSSKIWFTPWLSGINQVCHRSFGLLCRIRIILMRTRFEQEPRRIKSDVRKIWFFNVVLQCIALTIDWIIRHLCLVGVIGLHIWIAATAQNGSVVPRPTCRCDYRYPVQRHVVGGRTHIYCHHDFCS